MYQALGCTVRKGSATAIDDAMAPLAARVSDSTPSVRSCLVDVLGDWLLHQPDRYNSKPPSPPDTVAQPLPLAPLSFSPSLSPSLSMFSLPPSLRYSYHHKLIPLLLICTSDEVPDITRKAYNLWEKVYRTLIIQPCG